MYINKKDTQTVMPELGGPGGPLASQYLADQLTLFQPGRADYPHLLLLAPQNFSPSGITDHYYLPLVLGSYILTPLKAIVNYS